MANKFDKPPVYDDDGRVADPDTAREAAEIENKYRKKLFGVIKRSPEHVAKGEERAETHIEERKKIGKKEIPHSIREQFEHFSNKFEEGLRIVEAFESDLGGGVHRYYLNCDTVVGWAPNGLGGGSHILDDVLLTFDMRIVESEMTMKDGRKITLDDDDYFESPF